MAISFDTTQPSQTKGLNGYTVDPLFTVGDKIGDYVPPGILDGIGAYSLNDTTVRVYVNHELGSTAAYKYNLKNGTQLSGGRISYFDVDKRTLQITGSGLAYDTIINRAGKVVSSAAVYSATNVNGIDTASGLNRLCSAELFEANQFGAGKGIVDNIFLTGEESGGAVYALDTKTNALYALPWFGRAGFENVTQVDTGTTDKVAFIIGDDRSPATGVPLILYVGTKVAGSNDFLARNGLTGGKLFVWVADDPKVANDPIEADPRQFSGNNASLNGKFVEIQHYDATKAGTAGYDSLGFVTQATQDSLAFNPTDPNAKAFGFVRVEDVSTSPKDGSIVAFNATGNASLFGGQDSYGTVYRIDIDFNNINTGDIVGKVDILNDGNPTKDAGLRSPDNLVWAEDGKIYIQEDPAVSGFGQTSGLANSIFVLDPSVANPSSTLTRVAISDRSSAAVPATQIDSAPNDLGNWETSGITDVSGLFGNTPGSLLLFDVQAHSLGGGNIASQNLAEGGQLAFLVAPNANLLQSSSLVAGTSLDDNGINAPAIEAKVTKGFDGVNDIVFTGAGNDYVDSAIGGVLASGNNIDTGTGNDEIFIANGDRAFGSDGNDIFDAGTATNYRASGGAGDDVFYLRSGSNGRALGGDGNDKFFVGLGGGNLISGGAGADQFWIVNAELPKATNTVLDFQIGTDVIGIKGAVSLGITTANLSLTQVGSDTSIIFGGQTLAILSGIQASSLSLTNTNQFVLA